MSALSPAQSAAASDTSPRRVVLACPGAGKTRTLAAAVELAAGRLGPRDCVVITYTVKAAEELRGRLDALGCTGLGYCGTLHGWLLRLLRQSSPTPITVLTEQEGEERLREALADHRVKPSRERLAELLRDQTLAAESWTSRAWARDTLAVADFYRRCRMDGTYTFDMILAAGAALPKRCGGLFWDEFQDASDLDMQVLLETSAMVKVVVGDPRQAIYGFRGGTDRHLAYLATDPAWTRHDLDLNYRSSAAVVAFANGLAGAAIAGGPMGCEREIRDVNRGLVEVAAYPDPAAEQAGAVAFANGRAENKAILTRTRRHAAELAAALRAAGLPVKERREPELPADWLKAVALVALLAQPHSDALARRYLAHELGAEGAAKLADQAVLCRKSLAAQVVGAFSLSVRGAARKPGYVGSPWGDVVVAMAGLSDQSIAAATACAGVAGIEGGDVDLEAVATQMAAFGRDAELEGHGTFVGTAHSSKGLEFDHVMVAGCEEGSFPSLRKDSDEGEEARLFFVAATRAADSLLLTWCRARPEPRGPNLPPGPMQARQRSRYLEGLPT